MDKNFNELIPPYCLGCLDIDTVKEFNEFLKSGEDLNLQELGEFQNLIALLPSTMKLEHPGMDVKQKVAAKLYSIKNDVLKVRKIPPRKAEVQGQTDIPGRKITLADKIEKTAESTPENNTEGSSESTSKTEDSKIQVLNPGRNAELKRPPHHTQIKGREGGNLYTPYNPDRERDEDEVKEENNEERIEENFEGNIQENTEPLQEEEVEEVIPKKEFRPIIHEEDRTIRIEEEETPKHHYQGPEAEEEHPRKRNYPLLIGTFLLFFIIVIALIYAYMRVTADIKDYKTQVDRLNRKVSGLTLQLSSNQELHNLLNSQNVTLINLQGTDINPSGFGKLIISNDKSTGYIQLANMPALGDDKVYELWLSLGGANSPLGTFKPEESIGYYSFKAPALPEGYKATFIVTEEPSSGSDKPGYKVYLTGTL